MDRVKANGIVRMQMMQLYWRRGPRGSLESKNKSMQRMVSCDKWMIQPVFFCLFHLGMFVCVVLHVCAQMTE